MYHTANLILRNLKEDDFASFYALNADEEVMKYFPNTLTKESARIAFNGMQEFWKKQGFGAFSVEEKSSGKWIGFVGFNIPSFMPESVEMVWRLRREFWGKGYATEAAKKCIEIGFDEYKFKEIIAFTARINTKSIAVMKRAGFKEETEKNFCHPKLDKRHPLSSHVFYSIQNNL